MRSPFARSWLGETNAVSVTDAATPPAESHLLRAAEQSMMEVATTPYCGCAHLYEGGTAGLTDRYWAAVIAPAAEHCRVALTNAYGDPAVAGTTPNTWWTTDGGVGVSDVNTVPSSTMQTRVFVPTTVVVSDVTESGTWENDTPGASPGFSINRWGELQSLRVSYVEPLYTSLACGVSLCIVEQAPDLELL